MSFRIDDILKKEEPQHDGVSENCVLHREAGLEQWQRVDCNSILEQTLMNSRSYGGYKQPACDLYSAKLFSSWYNCDKLAYMPLHYDAYVDKGKLGINKFLKIIFFFAH